jgi:hypothetical protein
MEAARVSKRILHGNEISATLRTLVKRLRIVQAFAFDQHFRQMPGVRQVP